MKKRPSREGGETKEVFNTLLIDSNSLFKRSLLGSKSEYNLKAEHIGGVYQFFTLVRKILDESVYHRVYAFWDGKFSGKLKYELYEPYKSGRGKDFINGSRPMDADEIRQLKLVWEYLNEMYIRQIRDNIVESDDFIGYYCSNKRKNEKITIITDDRDMCQLIDEDIRIYVLGLKQYVTHENFEEVFGYKRENSLLIKIILGDNSDDIKGIKGLQKKTLFKLFPEFLTQTLTLDMFLKLAKEKQDERINNKQKPLKVLDNILNKVTDGIQGDKIYEINEKIMNLKKPLMTETAIKKFNEVYEGTLDGTDRDLKKVIEYMKRDGIDRSIGEYRFPDYLLPFKKLINRENYN